MLRVDEKTAERDHLIVCFQSLQYLGIEFALQAHLNFLRHVMAGVMLNIDYGLAPLLDNRFVRDGKKYAAFDDDLR